MSYSYIKSMMSKARSVMKQRLNSTHDMKVTPYYHPKNRVDFKYLHRNPNMSGRSIYY